MNTDFQLIELDLKTGERVLLKEGPSLAYVIGYAEAKYNWCEVVMKYCGGMLCYGYVSEGTFQIIGEVNGVI